MSIKSKRRVRLEGYLLPWLFVVLDYFAVLSAEYEAAGLAHFIGIEFLVDSWYVYLWLPLIFIFFLAHSRAYEQMLPLIDIVRDVFRSVAFAFVMSILVLYFFRGLTNLDELPRWLVLSFGLIVLLNTYVLRYVVRLVLKKAHVFFEPVILIGAGKTAERVLRFFKGDIGYRYDVIGIIDDAPVSKRIADNYLLYGGFDNAEEIIRDSGVQTVLITVPGMETKELTEMIGRIQPFVRNIVYVPNLIGTPMASVNTQVLFDEEILMLNLQNNLARRRDRLMKRLLDLLLSAIIILPLGIIVGILAVLIRLDSKGPAFYNAERIGKDNTTFKCYKFRSMYTNADEILEKHLTYNPDACEEWCTYMKLKDDPRVTRVGRIIRKYSLDELPQILNVIKGEMSLVGPRPYLPREKEAMGDFLPVICQTTPGITGLWQVSGRNEVSFDGRLQLDAWYVRNWSLWEDIFILFRTIGVVLGKKGAY